MPLGGLPILFSRISLRILLLNTHDEKSGYDVIGAVIKFH